MYRQVLHEIGTLLDRRNPPIILILGLRQVGKSTLAKAACINRPSVFFNFDLISDIAEFTGRDRHNLALFASRYKDHVIVVDEIQKSPDATGIVKHLHDTYNLPFLLTGSSELKIRAGVGDSLAGRLREIRLYPLSLKEIDTQQNMAFDSGSEFTHYEFNQQMLLRTLVYGSLPQLQNIPEADYAGYLRGLVNALLSRDILELSAVRKPAQVYHLARLLALQIGQLVNFNELAENTGLSRASVVNFIEIFEQMGLVTRAHPLSTNRRESITKRTKVYFTDPGMRNCLINDFSPIDQRADKGQLLENAVYMGISRSLDYAGEPYELGFFRSDYGAEIDIVKKVAGKEELFEVKAGKRVTRKRSDVTYITIDDAQRYLY
ncbi:MAG: ATP-binding protein [Candidatus Eremiobacteraeota bacterium]|nr:ATP-binding protein [Candidatus Eremiobacteraeota bacterium]